MQIAFIVIGCLMFLCNIASVYQAVIALFTFKKRVPYPSAAPKTRFAVVIPARNEENVIENLIGALKAQAYPADMFDIWVAVNNCTDGTRERVARLGARIFECESPVTRKGDALHQVIERLMEEGYDGYVFFDADNIPKEDFLARVNDAFCAGERFIKGRLVAGNAYESWVAGGFGLYHALMEWTYSRPHSAAGFSSNLVGTGVAVHREVFDALGGWNTSCFCEDTEFAAQATRAGYRVAWLPEAVSYDEQVAVFSTSLRQRRRWCRGTVEAARLMFFSMFSGDCPKKAMARDFGMLFLLSHTAPLAAILTVISLPFQPRAALLVSVVSAALSSVGIWLLAALMCRLSGFSLRRMWKTILLNPIFMISWVPLQVMALFLPVKQWSPIRHNGQSLQL